jgi:RimJ/RimL family protein N-acetyltransferase
MGSAIWPLFELGVSTPRLQLRYVTDDLGEKLAELAALGIHDPATMPFSEPWTDAQPPELQRNTLRFYWRCRAETASEAWTLNLAAFDDHEQIIGMCCLQSAQFAQSRMASTGSWIGRSYQRRGLGREMREAALHLLFAGLEAEQVVTRAWHDNVASLAVTRSLPYTLVGSGEELRRGHSDTMLTFVMTRDQWKTIRRNDIELIAVAAARDFLGLATAVNADPGGR